MPGFPVKATGTSGPGRGKRQAGKTRQYNRHSWSL